MLNVRTVAIVFTVIVKLIVAMISSWFDKLLYGGHGKSFDKLITSKLFKFAIPDIRFNVINVKAFNQPRTIYVSNHPGLYDGTILNHLLVNITFVAKDFGLVKNPLFNDLLTVGNIYYLLGLNKTTTDGSVILLEPNDVNKPGSIKPVGGKTGGCYSNLLEKIVELWPKNLWIFPSGSVVTTEFKSGAFRLAKQLGWKICPVRLSNFPEYNVSCSMFPDDVSSMSVTFGKAMAVDNVEETLKFCQGWCSSKTI